MIETLTCPVCRGSVAPRSSGCLACHLPIGDVLKNQGLATQGRDKPLAMRLWGVLLYGAAVAWCAYALPTTLAFVVPGAGVAVVLHSLRGRPVLGLAAFVLIVVVVPALLWPSMLTGALADL
jgi:hypothetical protein